MTRLDPPLTPEDREQWLALARKMYAPYRIPGTLCPRTAGGWIALLASLLESPSEAFVVPLAWAPTPEIRELLKHLYTQRRGPDYRGLPRELIPESQHVELVDPFTWQGRPNDFRDLWRTMMRPPSVTDLRRGEPLTPMAQLVWRVIDAVQLFPGLVEDGREILANIQAAVSAAPRRARRTARRGVPDLAPMPKIDPAPYLRIVRPDDAA